MADKKPVIVNNPTAPEVYAEIEKEALARTIADFTMDLDLTDLLKGTPDLPLYP